MYPQFPATSEETQPGGWSSLEARLTRKAIVGSSEHQIRLGSGKRWMIQLAPGYHSRALGVAKDAAGNLLVTGFGNDASGDHWIVRRLASNP
jgi:hypothetical protein